MDYAGMDHYPRRFHLACGTVLLGLALARSCWFVDGRWTVAPLPHYFMVADSGVGKGACVEVMYRIKDRALPDVTVVRKEATTAGIMKRIRVESGSMVNTLLIEAAEATTMLNKMDYMSNIIPVLTELADNGRYGKTLKDEDKQFDNVRCSIILGSNEVALRQRATASMIQEGIASRMGWLTARLSKRPLDRVAEDDPVVEQRKRAAVDGLLALKNELSGRMGMVAEAAEWFRRWEQEQPAEPADKDLTGQHSRGYLFVEKYAMLSALSRGSLEITVADLEWGAAWNAETARCMEECFASMRLSSYGKDEEAIFDWLRLRGETTWTEICRTWSGRLHGRKSVANILGSLAESGRVESVPTERGGGRRFRVSVQS